MIGLVGRLSSEGSGHQALIKSDPWNSRGRRKEPKPVLRRWSLQEQFRTSLGYSEAEPAWLHGLSQKLKNKRIRRGIGQ